MFLKNATINRMPDFTPGTYRNLIQALKKQGYTFQPFAEFLQNPADKVVVLRHDIDARKWQAHLIAEILRQENIKATFYFRIVPQSFDEKLIQQIAHMGHEIGYHYEDLTLAHGDKQKAIHLFEKNLDKLRNITGIKTICMHGSPLSRWDNRKIWKTYNYKDYGILGEPYFDIDFTEFSYLTDTGRRWDGYKFSVRDKVKSKNKYHFRSTHDIINGINQLTDNIMFTFHPQRWTNNKLTWAQELLWQNTKNFVKRSFFVKDRNNEDM